MYPVEDCPEPQASAVDDALADDELELVDDETERIVVEELDVLDAADEEEEEERVEVAKVYRLVSLIFESEKVGMPQNSHLKSLQRMKATTMTNLSLSLSSISD